MEDSFGFSWGFPESQSIFPLTGYYGFFHGACAYRFFVQDAISFQKSLRVAIGFGKHEDPSFERDFSKPGSRLQFSSTVYWYQVEPHAPLPAMPSAADRATAPEDRFWPAKEQIPSAQSLRNRGVKLAMFCGRPQRELIFAEAGYAVAFKNSQAWSDWSPPVYYCRSSDTTLDIELTVPPAAEGTLRLYMIDPDTFGGGRRQTVTLAGKSLGRIERFEQGRWLELPLGAYETATGKIPLRIRNDRPGANAVISMIEWVAKK